MSEKERYRKASTVTSSICPVLVVTLVTVNKHIDVLTLNIKLVQNSLKPTHWIDDKKYKWKDNHKDQNKQSSDSVGKVFFTEVIHRCIEVENIADTILFNPETNQAFQT